MVNGARVRGRGNRAATICAIALALIAGTTPPARAATFPPASIQRLPNGVTIVVQRTPDTPVAGVQIFLPAGLAQQPENRAGVAAVTAALIARTPVDRDADVTQSASRDGASVTYVIDPQETRFYIEGKAGDLPRLIRDLATAISEPSMQQLADAKAAVAKTAQSQADQPALVAYSMIRQVQYEGTGFAHPDAGSPVVLANIGPADVSAFASSYRKGGNVVIALGGNVTDDVTNAVKEAFGSFPSGTASAGHAISHIQHGREVVAHRNVAAPWIAVAYQVPSQFSPDFPAMLVIEALLGHGGDVHSFAFGSGATPPVDFVGGYYQYEADPGTFVSFYSGADVDQDLRTLGDGVTRLRTIDLTADLLSRAKRSALGHFLTSVESLNDQTWLLGRSAQSPSGLRFENELPARISAVKPSDVRRVAQRYLAVQTVAVVLPQGAGQ